MIAEVTRLCGPQEAQRYLRLREWLRDIFEAEFDLFMASNFDSPLDLVSTREARADLWKVIRLGGFGRLGRRIDSLIHDPRLRRIFTFQALYAGVPPNSALGVYGAIAHMDTTLGVYFPRGGMRTVALSMADALTAAGGELHLGRRVVSIDSAGRRTTAVQLDDGTTIDCDVLVLTPDISTVEQLVPTARRRIPARRSPSAVVLHGTVPASVTAGWPARRHHTIDFGEAWEQTFREITSRRRGSLMSDPSLLITRPAVSDPELHVGRESLSEPVSILAPCPNLDSAPLDWSALSDAYAAEILVTLEHRGYTGISSAFELGHMDTPQTWLAQGMAAGSPFADAHVFRQTGPFRRSNIIRQYDNVVLAGSSTVPGVGVPSVLLSGRLAAQRIISR
ncbi:MAG: phytoene desaturase, partial [Rhodococcus sp.]|nr:phytoene desaturase [Rhodococcus sp. (in: high G+C Gram-positive bacteria)]